MSQRAARFVPFADDLSFDAGETGDRSLRSSLPRGRRRAAAGQSPRDGREPSRQLVADRFADRTDAADDVQPAESAQGRTSLAGRLGLRVRFAAPDEARHPDIAIARGIAQKARTGVVR